MRVHRPFFLLFLIVLASRVVLLTYGNIPINDDEAQHGLMAKHMYELKRFYLYEIADPLHGGAALEAAGSALSFLTAGGISDHALRASPMVLSLLAFVSFYALAFRWWGRKTALISSALYGYAVPLTYLNFRLYGGYSIVQILTPWMMYLMDKILGTRGSDSGRLYFLMGVLSGFGVWNLEIIIPYLMAFILVWLSVKRAKGMARSALLFFIVGGLVGYLPAIVYNFTHDFSNWMFLVKGGRLHLVATWVYWKVKENGIASLVLAPWYIIDLYRSHTNILSPIPRFFEPDNEASLLRPISVFSWIQLVTVASIVFYWIAVFRRKILSLFRSIVRGGNDILRTAEDRRLFLIVVSLFIFVLSFVGNPLGCRFLSPIYPWVSLLTAVIFLRFYGRGGVRRAAGLMLIGVTAATSLWGYVLVLSKDKNEPQVEFLLDERKMRIMLINVSNNEYIDVISFLTDNGIRDIYAPHCTTFLFRYLSGERIDTASLLSPPLRDRDPEADERVRYAQRYAIVSFAGSPLTERISQILQGEGVECKTRGLGKFVVFYPLDRGSFSYSYR